MVSESPYIAQYVSLTAVALYFQAVKGDSAVQAGIKILPLLLAVVVTSISSGIIISIIGYYTPVLIFCNVLFAVGAGLITTWEVDTKLPKWFAYQVITGLGVGAGFQVAPIVVQATLTQEWVPVGTACVQFFQAFGGAIFVSVGQSVFQNGLSNRIRRDNLGIDPEVFIHSGASEVKHVLERMGRLDALDAVLEAYMEGLRYTFYISVACATCAAVFGLGLRWKNLKHGGPDAKGQHVPMGA